MNFKFFYLYTVAVVLLLFTSLTHAGSVTSLSRPATVSDPAGISYQKIEVKCSHVAEARSIVQDQGSSQWCSRDVSSVCGKNKLAAAKKVCATKFDSALADEDSRVTADDVATAVTDTTTSTPEERAAANTSSNDTVPTSLSLEQRRLELERQRVELRRKELELKRRQLELERAQSE